MLNLIFLVSLFLHFPIIISLPAISRIFSDVIKLFRERLDIFQGEKCAELRQKYILAAFFHGLAEDCFLISITSEL